MEQPSYICLELFEGILSDVYVFSRYDAQMRIHNTFIYHDEDTAEEVFLQWNKATNREEINDRSSTNRTKK